MLGPGFNSVLPCILTTSSTSREIISIALGDYSDHSLKSLNCNSTQKKSSGAARGHPVPRDKVYLLPFMQFCADSTDSCEFISAFT